MVEGRTSAAIRRHRATASSTAALVQPAELTGLTDSLRSKKVPRSIAALPSAPASTCSFFGILAERTGGAPLTATTARPAPADMAGQLAKATEAAVVYPESRPGRLEVGRAVPGRRPAAAVRPLHRLPGPRNEPRRRQARLGDRAGRWSTRRSAAGYEFPAPMWQQCRADERRRREPAGEDLRRRAQGRVPLSPIEPARSPRRPGLPAGDRKTAEQVGMTIRQMAPNNIHAGRLINGQTITLAQAETRLLRWLTSGRRSAAEPQKFPLGPVGDSGRRERLAGPASRSSPPEVRRGSTSARDDRRNRSVGRDQLPRTALCDRQGLRPTSTSGLSTASSAASSSALLDARNRREVRDQAAQAISRREIELERQRNLAQQAAARRPRNRGGSSTGSGP